MRNVILAVALVCALAVAGLGGTLAGWSDSEISYDNYIETGSLDLKVNDQDDLPHGTGVPTKVECECLIPCCDNCVVDVELWNAGQCCSGEAFIHFKHADCYNIEPKPGSGYLEPEGEGTGPGGARLMKTEPELVAEFGGWVDQVEVPGIGPVGDECSMRSHVSVAMSVDGVPVDLSAYDKNGDGVIKIIEIIGEQIPLCILEPCEPAIVTLAFHLQQVEDPDWEARGLPEKFKDWPTNGLQKDGITFDIEFDLIQLPKVVV